MKLVLKTVLLIAFICGIPATQAATSDGKTWGAAGSLHVVGFVAQTYHQRLINNIISK